MRMKFPKDVTHFTRADGSVITGGEKFEVEVTTESMRLELSRAGFTEVEDELAFPNTEDTRTVEEVGAHIKAENEATGEVTGDDQ